MQILEAINEVLAMATPCLLGVALVAFSLGVATSPGLRRWRDGLAGRVRRLAPIDRFVLLLAACLSTWFGGAKESGGGDPDDGDGSGVELRQIIGPPLRSLPEPLSGETNALTITSFTVSSPSNAVSFGLSWTTNYFAGLDSRYLDLFMSTNLLERRWFWLGEHLMPEGVTSNVVTASPPAISNSTPRAAFFRFGADFDADGDGLTDAYERMASLTSPIDYDTDGDGLSDGEELSAAIGTDPLDPDMDGDGVLDGDEIAAGANPLSANSDADALTDGEEIGTMAPLAGVDFLWLDLTNAVNLIEGRTRVTSGTWTVPLNVPAFINNVAYTNAKVCLHGLVHLLCPTNEYGYTRTSYSHSGGLANRAWSDDHVTVALCHTRLMADVGEWGSRILCGSAEAGGKTYAAIEYRNIGLRSSSFTNELITCQLIIPADETNAVYVSYLCASNAFRAVDLMCGVQCAALPSFRSGEDYYNLTWPLADGFPQDGVTIRYAIGTGTDPTIADTDGDGLSDADEARIHLTSPLCADTDGDGLEDATELPLGTDPLNPDTDGDGIYDGWETDHAPFDPLDPADGVADSDEDGLSNAMEITVTQTDWLVEDTDDDGLTDYEEWLFGTDPNAADSDGDGLSDGQEVTLGCNPVIWDTDGDGLSDGREARLGTNPLAADSDGDGISDKWEVYHSPFDPLNPADGAADSDGDGLSNATEAVSSHTSWQVADTDDDGLSDYAEWNGATDPLNPDTDNDGLSDGDETTLGTSPVNADTDGDGCPDGWEVRYGFNPLSAASPVLDADSDNDGLTNSAEASFGTNPFASDTDGDGLSDMRECGWAGATNLPPFDMSCATNIINLFSDQDEGRVSVELPFDIQPACARACPFLTIGINGRLALSSTSSTTLPSAPTTTRPMLVSAFGDDLVAYTNELGSALSVATFGTNGVRRFVVEYRAFGFHGLAAGETNSVSFQVSFAENEPDVVRVCYFRADSGTNALSARAMGSSAELSARTKSRELVYSIDEPAAIPGLALEYNLGTGTSPTEPDSDGDGIGDGDEVSLGLDPANYDTDGDGLPDGWEVANGLNPLNPSDSTLDPDEDGLTNGEEYLHGTNPLSIDSDGDGSSDWDEADAGSDPNDPDSTVNSLGAGDILALPFHIYGDYAAWEMNIRATTNDTRTFRLSTQRPGQSTTQSLKMRKGASYEITLVWRGSGEHVNPYWYCWEAQVGDPLSPDSRCFDSYDPRRLDGNEVVVGNGWICENADGLLTRHVHTNDDGGRNIAKGKKATLHILDGEIRADLDRDGQIVENELTSASSPLRMWLNDDNDNGSVQNSSSGDVPGASSPDSGNDAVDGLSDLEDLFPAHVDFGEALDTILDIPEVDPDKLEVRLSCNGATLGCVETDFSAATAGRHLSDPDAGVEYAHVGRVDTSGTNLTQTIIAAMRGDASRGVVLLEGKSRSPVSETADLIAEIIYDGELALSSTCKVLVAPVEEFYRWYNLRIHGGKQAGRKTKSTEPTGFPDSASDGTSVVFIHGFRVDAEGARAWNAEMFKRLWQSGCNSKFHAFTWRGNDGVVENGALNYHANVVHAFETAAAFAATNAQSVSGSTTVIAHSLGNMVVCSAIQDHGFRPDRFFMLNAAVPVEAFDATQWNTAETSNPFEFEDWVGYPSNSWASCWHSLFQTNDIRSRLTWKGRFADVPQLTTLYNYYSTGDEVLSIYDTPDQDGSGKITIHPFGLGGATYHSWQKQERFKGRWGQSALGGFGGTSEMGWGFSTQGYYANGTPPLYQSVYNPSDPDNPVIVRTVPYSTNAAHVASSAQLRADPVFNHEPPEILSGNLQIGDIDILLARGVPALSGPMGTTQMREEYEVPQLNLNALIDATVFPSWPHRYEIKWNGWLHSDVKDVAFPLVRQAFVNIIDGGVQ